MELKDKEMRIAFRKKLNELMLSDELLDDIERVFYPIANLISQGLNMEAKTQIIGINGPQWAGKSTFCELLKVILETGFGIRVATISIDDLYLRREERLKLSKNVHPLLITRGVPGTHDIKLGESVFDSLCNANDSSVTYIPRFNKAIDDRFPESQWERFEGRPDVILFDGWIVGATEQSEEELISPINSLEEKEDPKGIWRNYVNNQLKEVYKPFFDRICLLIMLQVPSFDKVYEWRSLQEQKLKLKTQDSEHSYVMNENDLKRFISHYERLTRHILKEMPNRADMVLRVNDNHRIFI